MSSLTTEERFQRLERVFMTYLALSTGELQAVCTPEEIYLAQQIMAQELESMRDDQK